MFTALEKEDPDVWIAGYYGTAISIRKLIFITISSDFFGKIVLIAVFMNTISLGMEGMNMSENTRSLRSKSNTWFTYIFIIEMVLKLIGLGLVGIPFLFLFTH